MKAFPLEAIEKASSAELKTRQLERLKWKRVIDKRPK
jgi:hypothetical protein